MSDKLAPHYPCAFDMVVYFTDDDGTIAKVTYVLPNGAHPTEAEIRAGIAASQAAVEEQAPGRFHLCDRREFVSELYVEKTGQKFAVEGPSKFSRVLSKEKLA